MQFFEQRRISKCRGAWVLYSHLECLRRAEGRASNVLMLEDDIALALSIPNITPALISLLNGTQWDFVYFGHEETGEIPRAKTKTVPGDIRLESTMQVIHTTHFYAVSGRILPRFIDHLHRVANGNEGDQLAGPMPIDGAFHIFRQQNPDVRCFIVVPKS